MAAERQSADSSEQVTPSRRKEVISQELFIPKDTLHQPYDVVLMVKDGREFKAHRRVLSEASSFFEKLLNSDMKETQEGVVRLEMFTESIMAATLRFIYTGDVQILAEDDARDLIVVADYLFLEKLKLRAGEVLVQLQTLNTSNCISTYYFAERYQCEDLLSNTRKFFIANFTSILVANRKDVLNMSSKEVEMWISSDEIDVSAEEDVFKIILAWIDHDRSRRKIFFAELFRHVRLVYVSRDFLRHDIVTNELVKDNNSCLTLVKDAINLLDSKNFESLSVPPRKSLETPVVVVNVGKDVLCYILREHSWCKLGEIPAELIRRHNFVSCDGQLYGTVRQMPYYRPRSFKQVTYNPYSNSCTELPAWEEGRYLRKTFVRNGDQMYALLSEPCVVNHLGNWQPRGSFDQTCGSRKHTSFLTKYKPEANSWEDVTSFDHLDLRDDFCIVANDNFIYFIGGRECYGGKITILTDVDRFEVSRKQWDKAADTQMAKLWAKGAAVNEKIYITAKSDRARSQARSSPYDWEVYDETTNEWQIITGLGDGLEYSYVHILAVEGELYRVDTTAVRGISGGYPKRIRIERYYSEENKWHTKTDVTARHTIWCYGQPTIVCSMRIFKGLFNMRQVEAFPFDDSLPVATTTQPLLTSKKRERKCLIM